MCKNDDKGIAVIYNNQQGRLKKIRWHSINEELIADFFERRSVYPVVVNVSSVKPFNGKAGKDLKEKKEEVLKKISKRVPETAHVM